MNEQIVIALKPTAFHQMIYIFSENCEEVPVVWESSIENLSATVNQAIEKYDLNSVRITGPKAYAEKFVDTLTHSISTQFGLNRKVDISFIG